VEASKGRKDGGVRGEGAEILRSRKNKIKIRDGRPGMGKKKKKRKCRHLKDQEKKKCRRRLKRLKKRLSAMMGRLCLHDDDAFLVYRHKGENFESIYFDAFKEKRIEPLLWVIR
ncbi:hypothetical protein EGW08_007833, partial [Elysia chlorotica]